MSDKMPSNQESSVSVADILEQFNRAEKLSSLYRRAWELYEGRCLWNLRKSDPRASGTPERGDVEAVAKALRMNGDLQACLLADRLIDTLRKLDAREIPHAAH